MTTDSPLSQQALSTSPTLPLLASLTAGGFLLLLASLHVIKSDLNPTWRVISEYEIGAHGWVMSMAFTLLAASCGALAVTLRHHVPSVGGRIGVGFLWVAATGLVITALATSDPITATSDELTTHGKVHGFGALLGVCGLLLAATLISRSLARSADWTASRTRLYWTTGFAWLGIVGFEIGRATASEGEYGPDVRIGWPNRFIVIAYCAWLMTVASRAARLLASRSDPDACPARAADRASSRRLR